MEYREEKVLYNIEVSKDVYKLKVAGSFKGNPGQFYMLRAWDREPLLSRPISIYNIDSEGIEFLYLIKGQGTEIFKKLREGDPLKLMGPIGNGFPLDKMPNKIALVSGGVGIAPLYYLAKSLRNCEITLYSGFRKDVYGIDEFKDYVKYINVTTEEETSYKKGYVTDDFNPLKYEMVISCGPTPMMMKLLELCREKETPLYLSLENKMACGVGACLCCTCETKLGMKRTCKDGPVFNSEDFL